MRAWVYIAELYQAFNSTTKYLMNEHTKKLDGRPRQYSLHKPITRVLTHLI